MNVILKNNTDSSHATLVVRQTRLSKICVKYRIKRYVPPSFSLIISDPII